MKRVLSVTGLVLAVIFIGSFITLHIWIGQSVKENIRISKSMYSGTAEEALISFLKDENNSASDRSHIAVWTLGQIRSEKAMPILEVLYKNDPKGKSCYGNHDSVLCQHEIHKAIVAIELNRSLSYARLNK
jgi:hypothetical protein